MLRNIGKWLAWIAASCSAAWLAAYVLGNVVLYVLGTQ
jgi:hypothetical protein